MRKKMKMRAGGKVKKYAEGGRVFQNQPPDGQRPTEDRARMAADAAARFDAEEEEMLSRRPSQRPVRRMLDQTERNLTEVGGIMNPNLPLQLDRREREAEARRPAAVMPPRPSDDVDGTGTGAAARPVRATPADRSARPARGASRARSRRDELSADDLNAMVLDRLGSSYSGRAIPANAAAVRARGNVEKAMGYKKGGKVVAKKKGGMIKAKGKR